MSRFGSSRFGPTYIDAVFIGGDLPKRRFILRKADSRVDLYLHRQAKGVVEVGLGHLGIARDPRLWERVEFHQVERGRGWVNYCIERPGVWLHEDVAPVPAGTYG